MHAQKHTGANNNPLCSCLVAVVQLRDHSKLLCKQEPDVLHVVMAAGKRWCKSRPAFALLTQYFPFASEPSSATCTFVIVASQQTHTAGGYICVCAFR